MATGFVLADALPAQTARAATPADATYGEAKPDALRLQVPWAQGTVHSVTGSYDSTGDHQNWAGGPQDYYALDFDFTQQDVYPVAAGTVLFAGWSGKWLGCIVVVQHIVTPLTPFQSVYAHLGARTGSPTCEAAALHVSTGQSVTPATALARSGNTGNTTPPGGVIGCGYVGTDPAAAYTPCSTGYHLHFALYQGAQMAQSGDLRPVGGTAVVPEPLVGQQAYENFMWFTGKMTGGARTGYSQSDPYPGGTWTGGTGGTPSNGDTISRGTPVVYKAHVTSSHPITEVNFTAGYADWADASGSPWNSPAFPSGSLANPSLAIWRIVGTCAPGQGCWTGTSTAGDVTFTWNPWSDPLNAAVSWLPPAKSASPTGATNRKICISFDVYDSSGARNLAPNGVTCDSSTLSSLAVKPATSVSPADTTTDGARLIYLSDPSVGGAPSNDMFANAEVILSGDLPHTSAPVDTTNATTEAGEPGPSTTCGSTYVYWSDPRNTVWYRYSPDASGPVEATTLGSGFDTLLAVYSGPDIGHLTTVGCKYGVGIHGWVQPFDAAAGTTYWIQVGGVQGNSHTSGLVDFALRAHLPANDFFADATTIGLPFTQSGLDTSNATVQQTTTLPEEVGPSATCASTYVWFRDVAQTVWYRYSPDTSSPVEASTVGSNFNTLLAVYSGPDIGHLSLVGCKYGVGINGWVQPFDAAAGTTYWFQVGGVQGNSHTSGLVNFALRAHAPANDFFADATTVGALPFTETALDTSNATIEGTVQNGTEPGPHDTCSSTYLSSSDARNTVWYRYSPDASGPVEASTLGSGFDTLLAVYYGPDINNLHLVGCKYGAVVHGWVQPFDAIAGTTYWFQVGGVQGNSHTSGLVDFALRAHAPANDFFADAAPVGVPFAQSGLDTSNASTEDTTTFNAEPYPWATCASTWVGSSDARNTVWYRYSPDASGPVEASTVGSGFDTLLAVYYGPDINNLHLVGCKYGAGTHGWVQPFDAIAGTMYWFQVGGVRGNSHTSGLVNFALQAHLPANDFFADATTVGALPFAAAGVDTSNATVEGTVQNGTEPGPWATCASTWVGSSDARNTVWYRYSPDTSGPVEANTLGSGFDTLLAVYSGPDINNLTTVGCKYGAGTHGWVQPFDAVAGTTYWVQVGGVQGDSHTSGVLDLAMTTGSVAPARAPDAPTGVTATAGNGSARVTWAAPYNGGSPITGYSVMSSPGGNSCAPVPATALSCEVIGLTNGQPYTFTVVAANAAGSGPASQPSAAVTPSVPPTSSVGSLPAYTLSTSITVTWSGTAGDNPIANYDVRYRSASYAGAFGVYTPWLSKTTAKGASKTLAAGYTYCFSTLARDTKGVTSAWSAERCVTSPLDDRSLTRSSGWTAATGSAYYRSTVQYSTTSGAKLTRTGVRARAIYLVATTCATCGSVRVTFAGTTKTISLRSTTTVNRKVILVFALTSSRSSTLTVAVYGSGHRVYIDGVVLRPI